MNAQVLVAGAGDGVRLITMNRPEAMNAFSDNIFDGVREALEEAAEDDGVRCVIITGAGRAFSAGSDLRAERGEGKDPFPAFMDRLDSFPKPLIAAVNGVAVGLGATMLAHCDLVISSSEARFRAPFTSLGLVPEAASTVTWPALMGAQRATHALLTSAWISAPEALDAGLVWRLVAPGELLEAATATAAEIAELPLEALVATKGLLVAGRLSAVRSARQAEDDAFATLEAGPAHREAVAAFRERRAPRFR